MAQPVSDEGSRALVKEWGLCSLTFGGSFTFQCSGFTGWGRWEKNTVAAMWMILDIDWSPLLGVILLDLSLSPPKGQSIPSGGTFSLPGL